MAFKNYDSSVNHNYQITHKIYDIMQNIILQNQLIKVKYFKL
jgi:hypothetical protein